MYRNLLFYLKKHNVYTLTIISLFIYSLTLLSFDPLISSSAVAAETKKEANAKSKNNSAEPEKKSSVSSVAKDIPTNINSEKMSYDADKQQVIFEGKVKVRRTDFNLDANKLTVLLKKNKKEESEDNDDLTGNLGAGDIDRLIAEGNVLMVKDGRAGECSKATYYLDKELMIMEGNPILREGTNTIKGNIINFYIKENRSEVLAGAGKPVEAVFTTKKKVK